MSTAELETEATPAAPPTCEHEGCSAEATHYTLEPQSGDSVIKTSLLCEEHAGDAGSSLADAVPYETPEPDPIEVERAAGEGMVNVDPPAVERSTKQALEDAERLAAIAKAADEVDFYEKTATEKRSKYVVIAEQAKDAKKAAEAADDDLRQAARRHRLLREGEQPDPNRYPLLDKPADATDADKAAINAQFPAPEPIPPVPVSIEAFQEMKGREVALEKLGFGKQILAKLAKGGAVTVADFGAKEFDSFGFTDGQAETVRETMEIFWQAVSAEWDKTQPDPPEAEAGATLGDGQDDEQHPPDDDGENEGFADRDHERDGMEGGDE